MVTWMKEKRQLGVCLDGKSIQDHSLVIMRELGVENDFKASRGWLYRFLIRHNYSHRRLTTSGRELPKNTKDIISEFIAENENMISNIRAEDPNYL